MALKTFVRPTNMGIAFVNAINSRANTGLASIVIAKVTGNDRPFPQGKAPYTRTEHDGIRVSQRTLDTLNGGNHVE